MARRKKTSKRKLDWNSPYIKKIKIKKRKRRKYNVWQASYNKEYKKAKAYIRKYGDIDNLVSPSRVKNPTLEDIEKLKSIHEANKAVVKAIRKQRRAEQQEEENVARDKYQAAIRAITRVLERVANMSPTGWESEKYEHAEVAAHEAMAANEDNEEWADAILANTADMFLSLKNFVFISKQTWDSNTINESTEWWDMFFDYIWGL